MSDGSEEVFEFGYREPVPTDDRIWDTECQLCGIHMKISVGDVLACPICDMADEHFDPRLERPNIWPNVYDRWVEEWGDDDEEEAA